MPSEGTRLRPLANAPVILLSNMNWIEIEDYTRDGWRPGVEKETRAQQYCEQLERGEILVFKQPPFDLQEGPEFLTAQREADARLHKNISYRPAEDRMRGFEGSPEDQSRMHQALKSYSAQVVGMVSELLKPYAGKFSLDYASFRPSEEEGRDLPLHKRNDLLHVDAFPSRPTWGGRILRVFTNINPNADRIWITGQRFPELAKNYAKDAGLSQFAASSDSNFGPKLMRRIGFPAPVRSRYDRFMLRFHDYLKENSTFQSSGPKQRLEFPPSATWLVFTDGVPHAALSGRFALEQTFIIPPSGLVLPEESPLRILEQLSRRQLA